MTQRLHRYVFTVNVDGQLRANDVVAFFGDVRRHARIEVVEGVRSNPAYLRINIIAKD